VNVGALFAVRVDRLTPLRWNVEIHDADTDKFLWKGVMGDGVIEEMGKRSRVYFMAQWKEVPGLEAMLILRDEIKGRTR